MGGSGRGGLEDALPATEATVSLPLRRGAILAAAALAALALGLAGAAAGAPAPNTTALVSLDTTGASGVNSNAALDDPAVRKRVEDIGGVPVKMSGGDFDQFLERQTETYRGLVSSGLLTAE